MEGDGAVDDAAAESKGTGEVNINIRCSDGSMFSVQISLESTVESFREAIAQKCDISPEQQLSYKGRFLRNDHQTLQSYGLEDGETVHLTREPAPAATTNTTGGTKDSTNSTSLTRDPMKTPVVQSLMNNPEFPDNIINDGAIVSQIIEAAIRDPELLREALLRINRQWPQGAGTQGGQASNPSTNFSSGTSSEAIARSSSPNTSPLPNPWREPPEQLYVTQLSQLQEMGFSDMQENIRALTATSGDVDEVVKQLSGNSGQ